MATDGGPKEKATAIRQTAFVTGEIIEGRYRVDHVLAEGAMGVIVAATHVELDEPVAMKFLKHEYAVDPEVVGRFAREAKAAARLKSEYIPAVHDVGLSPDRGPFIVMDLLEGEDFEAMLRRQKRIHFAKAAELMMQVGAAIATAHAHAIIHRDIKPANLFLLKSVHGPPGVKVLDFGVSKARLTGAVFGGAISLVKTQSIVGSPAYMSPEQLRGQDEIDATADIWSIGAVLYELITGRLPFTGRSVTELFAAMLETQPESVASLVSEVPEALSDVIMRCLARKARDRWQTAAELVVALAPFAPRRARASVDRAVGISKGAGLLPVDSLAGRNSSRPPAEGDDAPLPEIAQPQTLPRLFSTLVDTHAGFTPLETKVPSAEQPPAPAAGSPSSEPRPRLPRLFSTMVDTHGGRSKPAEAVKPATPEPPHPPPRPRSMLALIAVGAAVLVMILVWRRGPAASPEPAPSARVPAATTEPTPALSSANASPSVTAVAPPSATAEPASSLVSSARVPASPPSVPLVSRPPAVAPRRSPATATGVSPSSLPTGPAPAEPGDRVNRAIEDRK